MEDIRFTFFKINKCGYYPWAGAVATFGSVKDTLEQLLEWSQYKDLSETKISNPSQEDEVLATYLFDIKKYKDFWAIACWNETPSSDNSVASISPNSKVGSPKIHENAIVKGTIPGYPTYFLFFPKDSLMSTLRIGNIPTGRMSMEKYIGSFLDSQTSYVLVAENDGKEEILGYTNKDDNEPMRVWPKFNLSPVRKPGHEEFLRENVDGIRKIIKTSHINTSLQRDREAFHAFRRFIVGLDSTTTTYAEKRVYLEIDYEPTLEEFNEIVDNENSATSKKWDDVGFSLTGDTNIYWLGRSRASASVGIEVERKNDVIDLDKLVVQISRNITEIMAIANE